MYIHRSNRTERLLDALEELVRQPSGDPFTPECIAVQGRGMERWLSTELARRLGVWANPDFPFPRHLIERVLAAAAPTRRADGAAFEPERMLWSILALLPELEDRLELAPIRAYLAGDDRGVRAFQLAGRIADTFDHYAVHRPDLVLEWERGRASTGDWQPLLWRALVERHGSVHVAARAESFLSAAAAGQLDSARLPRRISLFGVSTLPPLYVSILSALAAHVEVHLFVLTPSREYWAQIRSERQILRALIRQGKDPGSIQRDHLHYEVGHPLLASLGRLGRDFQAVLEETSYQETGEDLYVDPGCTNALHTLQSDILTLRHRGPGRTTARLPFRADDASIRIHSCHAPMREVEVLHDQLLALFAEIPDLAPHEIVVMTPDIDAYAPAIEAVFGAASTDPIPYRISDRGPRADAEVVDAFERLLDLLSGRMRAPEILDLLGIAALRDRFGLAASDLELLRVWITEAGIRWGVDAAHRRECGQPALHENTWRFGLDRLLLGFALDDESALFGGNLPYVHVEGSSAKVLGALVELLELLFRTRERFARPHSAADWCTELRELLGATIADDAATADQVQELASTLDDLAERARAARFTEPIPLAAFRVSLASELRRRSSAHGFLAYGVCFCELVPMRTIPFRVLCLIGMNDGAFPRTQRPLGFDLIARHPRPGDRSTREDDRYLFLEALLAARERLLITYVGQSIHDNGKRPPSVVVSELLDALDETFEAPAQDQNRPGAGGVRSLVETEHPLQPFDPRYFDSDPAAPLFSFRRDQCAAARALQGERRPSPPFLTAPLAIEPASEVELDELIELLIQPSRWFARHRLGLRMGPELTAVASREPIALNALEAWAVGSKALEGLLSGSTAEEMRARLFAAGLLPPGTLGQHSFADLLPEVERAVEVARRTRREPRAPVEIDVTVDGLRVLGWIDSLWESGQVRVHFSRLRGRQDLAAWIRHVFLNLARPHDGFSTIVVGRARRNTRGTALRFAPLRDAAGIASTLVSLYRAGRRAPLPLFPEASRCYAETFAKFRDATRALLAARKAGDYPQGSGPNRFEAPEALLLFRGRSPEEPFEESELGALPSFAATALAFFGPLLDEEKEV